MPKFMIIDNGGNIVRTINLPYEGIFLDISNMPDIEWEEVCKALHEHKVEMENGKPKNDAKGLPVITKKSQK